MNYRLGDVVTVRKDLEEGEVYGGKLFCGDMVRFRGSNVTIKTSGFNGYSIKEQGGIFYWSGEMFDRRVKYNSNEIFENFVIIKDKCFNIECVLNDRHRKEALDELKSKLAGYTLYKLVPIAKTETKVINLTNKVKKIRGEKNHGKK